MWLFAGLGYDGRNFLDAIREVSLLTPAQLWGHQQLPSLVDAVFILCNRGKKKAENYLCWSSESFKMRGIKICKSAGNSNTNYTADNTMIPEGKDNKGNPAMKIQCAYRLSSFENKPVQRFSAEHFLGSSLLCAHGIGPLLLCWLWIETTLHTHTHTPKNTVRNKKRFMIQGLF